MMTILAGVVSLTVVAIPIDLSSEIRSRTLRSTSCGIALHASWICCGPPPLPQTGSCGKAAFRPVRPNFNFVAASMQFFHWVRFSLRRTEDDCFESNPQYCNTAGHCQYFVFSQVSSPGGNAPGFEAAKLIRYRIPELESKQIGEAIPPIRSGFDFHLDARGFPERRQEPLHECGRAYRKQ